MLGDDARHPRYIRTVHGLGYAFCGTSVPTTAEIGDNRPGGLLRRVSTVATAGGYRGWMWAVAFVAVWLAVTAALGIRLGRTASRHLRPAATAGARITRLTSDAGLSFQPSLSPDGNLVAYSSDRAGEGNLDIWVKQVAGEEPIRLTSGGADEVEPAFSADGAQVAYRSVGDGIYVVSALGGMPRRVAGDGRRPRFSPDGSRIAYWVGDVHIMFSQTYVVSLAGGAPRRLQPGFALARYPTWSPDGTHILFEGSPDFAATFPETFDWWVAPSEGGQAVQTRAFRALGAYFRSPARTQLALPVRTAPPGQWLDGPSRVAFSFPDGDSTDLWEIAIRPATFQVPEPPRRLTMGPGAKLDPGCAASGRLIFSNVLANMDVWSLPIRGDGVSASGDLQRLTRDASAESHPLVSADGRTVVFHSDRSGKRALWWKDLRTGEEAPLTAGEASGKGLSGDGSRVAFASEGSIYLVARGGIPEKLCEGCATQNGVWHLSSDGKKLLHDQRPNGTIALLDIPSRRSTSLASLPGKGVWDARLSPDDGWIAFHSVVDPGRRQLFIAPFHGPREIPRGEWMAVTDGSGLDGFSAWSPQGGTCSTSYPTATGSGASGRSRSTRLTSGPAGRLAPSTTSTRPGALSPP